MLENGQTAEAEREIAQLRDIFGPSSTYLEIQNAGLAIQKKINDELATLSKATGLPLVATGETSTTSATRTPARTRRLHPVRRHARQPQPLENDQTSSTWQHSAEMGQDFADYPDAVARTLEIAERCNVTIELGVIRPPRFPTPDRVRPSTTSVEPLRAGAAEALWEGDARAPGAAQVRAEDDPRDGVRGLP